MASYNRIILVGNLTRDPELSYTPANTAICKFGLATNHKWKDREGNQREEVCFVDCTLFGRGGEVFKQYMSKGRPTLIEGRLKLDQWTTPEGVKRSKHVVIVENFTFLGGAPGGGQHGAPGGPAPAPGGSGPAPSPDGGGGGYEGPPPPADDDIPF